MRVIDDRGMLFGRINIIDSLVILFLVCSAILFFFGYKVISKKEPLLIPEGHIRDNFGQERFITLDNANFIFNNIEPDVLGLISIGDKERGRNDEVIGEIIFLGNPEAVVDMVNMGNNKEVRIEDKILKKITATLKMKVELRGDGLYYKDKKIMINSNIAFKTDKYRIEARCISLGKQPNISEAQDKTDASGVEVKDRLEVVGLKAKVGALEAKVGALEAKVGALEAKTGEIEVNRVIKKDRRKIF